MSQYFRSPLTAVLGPTNTGKTHLAIERMLGHSSGMIGFPLRLLAREVYDRVVRMRGAECAALVTGEERIWPATARYLMCTAEAMPIQAQAHDDQKSDAVRDVAFVALDEAQLAQDRDRGHVFTTRLLHARGREETMILGSATLAPVIRHLLPQAEITSRPRFSTLSYAGPRKLSRLPPRTAIIAFSAEEVYTIAEALRRLSGGAAVVMGSLSPATRNAQVAMFQSGEVDYLVATDAVGMGLNLDVEHVAFASLNKFDGVRQRRLNVSEMAQIAGRAGRHQRDGTFGSIGAEAAFTPEEIAAIENHRFPPMDWVYWRNPDPSMASVAALIADLEAPPIDVMMRPAPLASDLAVMQLLHGDADAMAPIDGPAMVRRFRDACSLPDFRRAGPEAHGRLVSRVWRDLSHGDGHVDADWFMGQLRPLDLADGSVEVLADRIASVRSYCYIAQRADWLADADAMAGHARDVEQRLSDALHGALTARFVDRRTAVLLRALGQDASALPVAVDEAGAVRVDGELIGQLDGFTFWPDPTARAADRRMVLAAAEKYLTVELASRATALAGSDDAQFSIGVEPGQPPTIIWGGTVVATLVRGKHLLSPNVALERAVAGLDSHVVAAVQSRLDTFVDGAIGRFLRPLVTMGGQARDMTTPAPVRAIFAAIVDGCGIAERRSVVTAVQSLDDAARVMLRSAGIRMGYADMFNYALLRPAALEWLTALRAAWREEGCGGLLPPGIALLADSAGGGETILGLRRIGHYWLRVDLVQKIGVGAHAVRNGRPSILKKKRLPPEHSPLGREQVPVGRAEPVAVPPPVTDAVRPAVDEPPVKGAFRVDPELARSIGLPLSARIAALQFHGMQIVNPPAEVTVESEPLLWWRWNARKTGHASGQSRTRVDRPLGAAPDFAKRAGQKGRDTKRTAPTARAPGPGTGAQPPRQQGKDQDRAVRAGNPFAQLAGMFDKKPDGDE